jgi:putative aldouronate transport system substrate-binding protein
VEGTTYTEENGVITYSDELRNSESGVYKTMQVEYGCGSDVTQMVWYNAREMTKYDENYSRINAEVATMGDVIQPIPPTPLFNDATAEEAGLMQTALFNSFDVWVDAFLTGKKSVDTDWDAYVSEMKGLQIEDFCKLYNDNMRK